MLQTTITRILIVFLNLASGVMTARLLGATGRGIFTTVTVWPQFLAYVTYLGLPAAFVYYLKGAAKERGVVLTSAMALGIILSSLAVIGGIILVPFFMEDVSSDTVYLAQLCILGTFPLYMNAMLSQALVGLGRFTDLNIASYLNPLLYVLTMLAVWRTVGLTPGNAAACLLVAVALTDVWMAWKVMRLCKPRIKGASGWMSLLTQYSLRASAGDVLSAMVGSIDRLILISFISSDALGRYAVAYSFSRLIQILQVGVIMVLFPSMTGRPIAEVKRLHDHSLRFMLYGVAVAIAGLLVIGPHLLVLLYGPDFQGLGVLCGLLCADAGLTCIAIVIVQLYMSTGNPGFASVAQVVSFIAAVGLLLLLLPRFGAEGAAAALLISTVLRLLVLWAGIRFRLSLKLPRLLLVRSDIVYLRQRLSL
jgi:O-antigen/teichoic acid export membrane protein